jgi:hypothetical protein
MSQQFHTFQLSFPKELSKENVNDLLLTLAGHGSTRGAPVRFAARSSRGKLTHFITVPAKHVSLVRRFEQHVPGLVATELGANLPTLPYVWKLWQSSSRRPLRRDREELTARALLISMLATGKGESLELRWLLGPVRRPLSVGTKHPGMTSETWGRALLTAAFVPPGDLDAEARKALRDKRSESAWRVLGQIAVAAPDRRRAQQLAANLMAAIRTSEAPGVQIGVRRSSPQQLDRMPWRWPMEINTCELTGLLAWPIGDAGNGLPVSRLTHRSLEPTAAPGGKGRLLGKTPAGRNIVLSDNDSSRHLHVMAPTGTGKSTFLMSLILQDIEAGKSVVVLDEKGDLIDDVLRRYPLKRMVDLVVLDPTELAPVGLNPLAHPRNPELVADQLLGIFSNLFRDSFGPRTADVLHASLTTLARWGEGSLAVLPMLLTNPGLRHRIVGHSSDPLGTGPFWAWYEKLSPAEMQQIIAPSMNKLRPFLLRPDLRAVVGQVKPRFDLKQLLTKRRVLLVSLAKGQLGPEGSALLGSVLLNQLFQTILSRSSIPAAKRHPIGIYLDEFQGYLKLPGDVGEALAQARSMNAQFTLAHQHLDQLPINLKASVLANARSRVLFQLAPDDAKKMANGHPELTPADLMGLPAFEAYASLLVGNEARPFISLRSEPPSPESGTGHALRRASTDRYGVPRAETEDALRNLSRGPGYEDTPVGGRSRRPS